MFESQAQKVAQALDHQVRLFYVLVQQGRYHYPTIFNWPSNFGGVADVAWLAVMLLAADAFVQVLRWRARRRTQTADRPDERAEQA